MRQKETEETGSKLKIVVITGGAAGIGKCMAEEFKKAGAKVAVIDFNSGGVDCDLYYCGDIAEKDSLEEFARLVIERYGKVDYLIHNACLSRKGILSGCSYEDFNYVLRVGVSAPYYLTHALAISLRGIARVNSIAPGWIDTEREEGSREGREQHPVKRVGRPEDIAKMAMYLCSEDSSFITGENITIDGGMTKQMIYHNDLGWSYQ